MRSTEPLAIIRQHWHLVKNGTPDQLAGLINQLRPFLKLIARGLMPDWIVSKADDSDVVQDTLSRATQSASRFQGESPEEFWAWLITIQRNEINHLLEKFKAARRDFTREQTLDVNDSLTDGRNTEAEISRQETIVLRERTLKTLRPDDQMVIRLRIYQGKSLLQIAQLMDREYESVKKLYSRAILKWKRACDEQAACNQNSPDLQSPKDELSWQANWVIRDNILQTLSSEDQKVIRLRIHEGKSLQEIAQLLGIEQDTIRKVYTRAIRKLKRSWDDHHKNG